MDLDLEKVHNILLAANLPSSINDLKNPTEEFVVNLMNTFLKRFCIDFNTLTRPTLEQQDIMMYHEDSDIIGLINLHIVMVQICDRIYVKDLCITDITSPGSKRVRKQAQFLANFILYASNKESYLNGKIDEIESRAKMLQHTLHKKNEALEAINEKALHTAKQLMLKEKYAAEIQEVQSRLEKNNKRYDELKTKESEVEEKKREAVELRLSHQKQIVKLDKIIKELQSEIVKSPEEYEMRLKELEEQQSSKVKEREMLQDAFQDKKHLMEQQKNILTFIQKQLEKFTEVRDIHEKLKKMYITEDSLKKEVETLKEDIGEFEKRLETQKDLRKESEVNELHAQYKERLSPLHNLSTQLLSNKKVSKEKLEEVQVQYNEDCLKLKKMQSFTKKLEEETIALIRNYQEIYDNEIMTEKALWETWKS